MVRFRSVTSRIIALHVAAIIATSICIPLALFLMLRQAVELLHHQALRDQAGEIVHYLSIAPDGSVRLSLPPGIAEFYSQGYGRAAYAVIDDKRAGLVLVFSRKKTNCEPSAKAANPIEFFQEDPLGAIAPVRSNGVSVNFFDDGSERASPFTVRRVRIDLHDRPILVQVVEDVLHRDVLIDDILAQFLTHVGWVTAPILLLLLVIDVAIFRRAMQPVVAASSLAGEIGPDRMELRLPEAAMPLEVLPLVQAVNRALDRLDAGFRAQREFTADAAHELRTPLAILRTQIDMIEDRELAEPLRHDVESMSRLVNQLLEISELDSFFISEGETADLVAIATEVAAFLAPLAVSQGKTFAVTGARRPVRVRGNSDAIARAVRNLAENALAHTARWYDGRARRRGARNNSRPRSWSRGTKNRAATYIRSVLAAGPPTQRPCRSGSRNRRTHRRNARRQHRHRRSPGWRGGVHHPLSGRIARDAGGASRACDNMLNEG